MAEAKDKSTTNQSKTYPKDGQVIMSIMKESGIQDYEPKTIVQLTEFVYRYATSILEEARMYANNAKSLGLDDVKLALQLTSESTFTTPPPREVVLECANIKNYTPLPIVKVHCGLRLPPDRHCLSSCNYVLKSSSQKKKPITYGNSNPATTTLKLAAKANSNYIKRPSNIVPKPNAKITTSSLQQQKTILKPKIQIASHNVHISNSNNGSSSNQGNTSTTPMDIGGENSLKRKREDDGDI